MVDLALTRRGSDDAPLYVTSANGQVLSLCSLSPAIRSVFLAADLIHADGMPLVCASRLLCREPLPERVATTDLVYDVAEIAVRQHASFFLLGGTDAVATLARRNLERRYPRLVIAGSRGGYFSAAEEDSVVDEIRAARPHILWVAMGVPREQMFVVRNRERLHGVGLIKTAGGLLDFVSETNKRAPRWMQEMCLEWLYRLCWEPRRLAPRYVRTNPHALYLLLTRSY